MRLIIKGGFLPQRKSIREMARWFGKAHLSKQLDKSLRIHIELKELEDEFGATVVSDNILKRPKYFDIQIHHGQRMHEFRKTFFHELWHIRQFATDTMYDYQTMDATRFKGKIYPQNDEKENKAIYLSHEWEVEARGMEDALVAQFNHYKKERKKK